MSDHPNYNLDKETAADILNNILDTCNIPPSSESIETSVKKTALQRKKISACKYVAILFILLAVLTPLAFNRDPNFSIVTTSKTVAVTSHTLYENFFVMTLQGAADYGNIHAKKNDGAIIFPDNVDASTGLVVIPYNGEALNIYIPTVSGECIQAVLNETK